MLGPEKARDLDRPVLVSLEALVPRDHFYRHLERRLDLSFVRELVRDRYAPHGGRLPPNGPTEHLRPTATREPFVNTLLAYRLGSSGRRNVGVSG